jgi:hypothetical protein
MKTNFQKLTPARQTSGAFTDEIQFRHAYGIAPLQFGSERRLGAHGFGCAASPSAISF